MAFYQTIYKLFARPIRAMWRVSVSGTENIPDTGCLLVCNHTSMTDALILEAAATRQIRFMGKKELFKIPLLKQLITALGAYPVNRGGTDVTSINRTISMLESGELIGIFPQGTRHPYVDPRTTEVKGGVGMIAYYAKTPVLPVYIDGAAGKTKIFRRNRVTFGKPISFEELGFTSGGRREYTAASQYMFRKICSLKYGEEDNTEND